MSLFQQKERHHQALETSISEDVELFLFVFLPLERDGENEGKQGMSISRKNGTQLANTNI